MVPSTELRYNYEYAKRLYQGDKDFEDIWQRIIGQGGIFEELYEESIDNILELIPQYSGFAWEDYADNFIPIYLIDSSLSLAHPLTLSINGNPGIMLIDLVYELARCNMYCGFKTRELKEECLNLVTRSVIEKLNLDFEDEINDFEKSNEEKSKITPEKTGWDLNQKTIKELIGQ